MIGKYSEVTDLSHNTVFDQEYSPAMKDHPYMDKIKTEEYSRYKDLTLVW
jgi:hypothetical protein